MSECEKCKTNPAIVRIEQYINGKKSTINLCSECASIVDNNVSIEGFLKSMMEHMWSVYSETGGHKKSENAVKCENCGLTYDEFRKVSRFGCSDCYDTFKEQIEIVLKNIQGVAKHEGKIPKRLSSKIISEREIDKYKRLLQSAIMNEEYENAAIYRDKIKELSISNNE